MVNGDCVVGATNTTRIAAAEEDIKEMKQCVNEVKRELATFKYLLVATLVGVVVQLVMRVV